MGRGCPLESFDARHSVPGFKPWEERGRAVSGFLWLRCHHSVGLRGMGQAQAMPATAAGQTGAVSGGHGVREGPTTSPRTWRSS